MWHVYAACVPPKTYLQICRMSYTPLECGGLTPLFLRDGLTSPALLAESSLPADGGPLRRESGVKPPQSKAGKAPSLHKRVPCVPPKTYLQICRTPGKRAIWAVKNFHAKAQRKKDKFLFFSLFSLSLTLRLCGFA